MKDEIGGTHYSEMVIEPIEIINIFNLDFTQGNIFKYISRYKKKNGIEDLLKARHYCSIGFTENKGIDPCKMSNLQKLVLKMYCIINDLNDMENMILGYVICEDYAKCHNAIDELIEKLGFKIEEQ